MNKIEFIEWHDCRFDKPPHTGIYLTWCAYEVCKAKVYVDKETVSWNVLDNNYNKPTHWAYLPKGPEGNNK